MDRTLPCQAGGKCHRVKGKQLMVIVENKFTADKAVAVGVVYIARQRIPHSHSGCADITVQIEIFCLGGFIHCYRTISAADDSFRQIAVMGSAHCHDNGICAGSASPCSRKADGQQSTGAVHAIQRQRRQLDLTGHRCINRSLGAGKHVAVGGATDRKDRGIIIDIHIQRRNILKIFCFQGHIGSITGRYCDRIGGDLLPGGSAGVNRRCRKNQAEGKKQGCYSFFHTELLHS